MWNPKVYNIFHELCPLALSLILIRLRMCAHCYFKIHFTIILFQRLDLPKVFHSSSFLQTARMDEYFISAFRAIKDRILKVLLIATRARWNENVNM